MKWLPQNQSGILPGKAVGAGCEPYLSARSSAIEYFIKHPPLSRLPDHEGIRYKVGGKVRHVLVREHWIQKSRRRREGNWGVACVNGNSPSASPAAGDAGRLNGRQLSNNAKCALSKEQCALSLDGM